MGADEIQSNWMPYLLVAALLATPWITSSLYRRWSSFVIVYLVVTWFQMAILKKTGAAVHHVILLWPMGHLLIGIVASQLIAGIRWRRIQHLICMILIFAIGRNLLVLHSYHTDLSIYGTQPIWTDASDHFRSARLLARPSRVVAVDWGYAPTLCLLNRGRAEIIDLSYHLADPVATNTSLIKSLIDDRHSVFVGRPDNQQQFPGVQQRIDSIAAAMGRRRTTLATLDDRLSKMRFHLFRYVGGTTTQIERITSIDTANPNHAMRLQGFHEIEQGNFRWTQRSFSVLLDKPGDDAMQLMIVFSVPQSLISRLGSLKLRATVEGTSQSTPVITQPGQFRQIWKFPPCRDRQVTIQFELDNFLHAGAVELRELGLIVKSVELTSVY